MNPEDHLLTNLRQSIEAQLNWGPAEQWTNKDFQELGDRISEKTTVALSPTTLKRVWGRVAYASQPSTTTLDALAVFAGYDHWRAFRAQAASTRTEAATATPPTGESSAEGPGESTSPRTQLSDWQRYGWLVEVALLLIASLFIFQPFAPAAAPTEPPAQTKLKPADYHLSFRPVTTGVPNSVVFNYDASKAPTDSVFLQQSWDRRRREKLDRNENTHTSIYYLPGYFSAKLVVGDQVVAERELFLRSDDWVAAVDLKPVPVYLPLPQVHQDGQLAITEDHLTKLGLVLQPRPPKTVFTHVGKMNGLWSDDFSFQTRLRHDYATGAAACQHAQVLLLLKNGVIAIPLSAPGCVADLSLYAGGQALDGRNTDLSAFGVVGDAWLDLSCTGQNGLLTFSVNGQQVLQLESNEDPKEIIGIRYEFSGMGSVGELRFSNSSGEVWREAF